MDMENKNYYEILGVSETATLEEIKKAYRDLSKKWHPDYHPDNVEEATKMQQKINAAFETLKDETKRENYDWKLKREREAKKQQQSQRANTGNGYGYGGYNQGHNYGYSGYSGYNGNNQGYSYKNGNQGSSTNQQQSTEKRKTIFEEFWGAHTTKTTQAEKERARQEKARRKASKTNDPKENFEEFKKEFTEAASTIYEKYKKAYGNAREFEKKHPFSERHNLIIDEWFNGEKMFEDCQTIGECIEKIFSSETLMRIFCHGSVEVIWLAEKLKKYATDDIPTYVMRNRRAIAGTLAGIYILFGMPGLINKNAQSEATSNNTAAYQTYEDQDSDIDIKMETEYTLNRIYTVQSGDSLSKLSQDSNTTINYIMKVNGLDSENIQIGQTLKIPYIVEEDELKYYTESIEYNLSTSLEEIAEMYGTDVRTLYSINTEALESYGDSYVVMSDTILVPTFPTQREVNEQKANDSYQKTS